MSQNDQTVEQVGELAAEVYAAMDRLEACLTRMRRCSDVSIIIDSVLRTRTEFTRIMGRTMAGDKDAI